MRPFLWWSNGLLPREWETDRPFARKNILRDSQRRMAPCLEGANSFVRLPPQKLVTKVFYLKHK